MISLEELTRDLHRWFLNGPGCGEQSSNGTIWVEGDLNLYNLAAHVRDEIFMATPCVHLQSRTWLVHVPHAPEDRPLPAAYSCTECLPSVVGWVQLRTNRHAEVVETEHDRRFDGPSTDMQSHGDSAMV